MNCVIIVAAPNMNILFIALYPFKLFLKETVQKNDKTFKMEIIVY